ncbi:MAG: (Fe-S)-binding protein [bacterium]|nr:(Fe-S)-binding protein [bacterium]
MKRNDFFNFIKKETEKCVNCGKCKSVCDMYKNLREEEYSPRGLVQLARRLNEIKNTQQSKILEYFYTCFLCGKCSIRCPAEVQILNVIISARALLSEHSKVLTNLNQFKNKNLKIKIKKILSGESFSSLEKLKKLKNYNPRSSSLFFPGCFLSDDYLKFLERSEFNFTLDENIGCCGYLALASGFIDIFENEKKRLEKVIRARRIERIITACPHCFYVLNVWHDYRDREIILLDNTDAEKCPECVLGFNQTDFTCTGFGGLLPLLNPEIFSRLKEQNKFFPKCSLSKKVGE